MRPVLSSILFLASLPPFDIPLVGCFFLVPLLINRQGHIPTQVAVDGFVFALIISGYSYFGTWTYDIYAYVAIVFIFSLLFSTFLFCTFLIISRRDLLALLIAPLLWTFIEITLSYFNLPVTLVIPLTVTPALLMPAQYGGQQLLSILLIGFQLTIVVLHQRQHARLSIVVPASSLVAITSTFLLPALINGTTQTQGDIIDISIVQTNAHPRNTLALASDDMLESLAHQRLSLLQDAFSERFKPELIILPEVSIGKYEFRNKSNISQQAALFGIPILVASPDLSASGQTYNSVFSLSSSGTVLHRYNKNILIPFIEDETNGQNDWSIHDKLPGRPGSIICYESVFSRPAVMLSAAGAGFISLATNDAYAGPSILAYLHLQFSRLRAVETGKTIIRAANAGPSTVITANGRVGERLALFTSGTLHARIQANYTTTFFVRHFRNIQIALWVLSSVAVIIFLASCARSCHFQRSGQAFRVGGIMSAITLLGSALVFQHYYMRHIYQISSGNNLPDTFVNFQHGHINDTLPYQQLKVDTPIDSLLSAITYLLRDLGNDVNLTHIRAELSSIIVDSNATKSAIDISSITDRFGYDSTSENFSDTHAAIHTHIKTPCIVLLETGETVVITDITDNGVIFFSPYYGQILSVKTKAFLHKWTGKTLTLSARSRPWDI